VSSLVYDEVMKAIIRILTEIDLSVCFKSGQAAGEGVCHCPPSRTHVDAEG
jgi:hypothetical protein